MSDDNPDTPDGWNQEAVEMMAEQAKDEQPDSVDSDSNSHQEAGWMKFYVECPNCETPMTNTTTETSAIDTPDFIQSATESRYRFICPDCSETASHVRVERVTAEFGEIKRAYGRIREIADALLDAFRRGFD